MDLTRRSFLRGALAIAAVSVVPIAAQEASTFPVIVGDGVHDDTAGIQAAFDGMPFVCEGHVVTDARTVKFVGRESRYKITSPVTLRRDGVTVDGGYFLCHGDGHIGASGDGLTLKNMSIKFVHGHMIVVS